MIQNTNEEPIYIYTPEKTQSDLNQLFKSQQINTIVIQQKYFIDYCYLVLEKYKRDNSLQQLKRNVFALSKLIVKPTYMPCLIYQHLLQTFCSLVEALIDDDNELALVQIQQIQSSLQTYMTRPSMKPHRGYQSYFCLQITDNLYDIKQKQRFYKQAQKLMQQFSNQKLISGSKYCSVQGLKAKAKEKRERLKERNMNNIQPLLTRILSKKGGEQNIKDTQQNQQRDFVLQKNLELFEQVQNIK